MRDVRHELPGVTKEEFDRVALGLAREREIVLHYHDFPASLSPAGRDDAIKDGRTYYHAIGLSRSHQKNASRMWFDGHAERQRHTPNAFDYQAYNLARKFEVINKRRHDEVEELKRRGLPLREYRVAYGAILDRYDAEKDEVRRKHEAHHPNASYYVWVMGSGDEPLDEGVVGPHDLGAAKTYARIAATEGVHDRVVSVGRSPTARSFRVVRRYQAGTGKRTL
jgi:hypothetical protein